eukprot:175593-Rhodomonas_salina.3
MKFRLMREELTSNRGSARDGGRAFRPDVSGPVSHVSGGDRDPIGPTRLETAAAQTTGPGPQRRRRHIDLRVHAFRLQEPSLHADVGSGIVAVCRDCRGVGRGIADRAAGHQRVGGVALVDAAAAHVVVPVHWRARHHHLQDAHRRHLQVPCRLRHPCPRLLPGPLPSRRPARMCAARVY